MASHAGLRSSTALLLLATLVVTPLGAAPARSARAAGSARSGYNLAFVDADARHVLDAVLGDILHANYTIDPKVSGTITLRTAEPVDRDGVIALLEKALEPIGAAVLVEGSSYRIVPIENARVSAFGTDSSSRGQGYGGQVVTLKYASPAEMARLLSQFVGKNVVAGIDPATNQIMLAGSSGERDAALAVIKRFDVDTMSSASFQVYRLQNVDAEALERELSRVLQPPFGPGSRVRFVPLPRMRSILVIGASKSDLARVEPWIQRLDEGAASTKRRLYSYSVQNGRARDLAASLQMVLGRGTAASEPVADQQTAAPRAMPQFGPAAGGSTSGGTGAPLGQLQPSDVIGPETPLPGPNASAVNASTMATAQDGAGPRIVPVDTNNSLLIYADGEEFGFVRDALDQLDRPVAQVMIEATLAEVTLTNDLSYGVDWRVLSGNSAFTLSNTASATPAASFPGFSYSYIGKSVDAVLNTLQAKTKVRVLSAPKLMVLNNQTATLQVGDQVPIVVQQSQSVSAAGAPLVNTVELHDTGVILKVTPRVNDSGTVTLDIAQEVSDVTPTTTSNINSPTIAQRRLTSTIATRSGQMVALGGLIRENSSRGRQGIPILSQIPVLGAAFGRHVNKGDRTELIILLTPMVMRSPAEAPAGVDELLKRMDILRGAFPEETGGAANGSRK